MKLRINITDENGTRQFDSEDVEELRNAADALRQIAFEHDPDNRHKPGSAVRITRFEVTWEA